MKTRCWVMVVLCGGIFGWVSMRVPAGPPKFDKLSEEDRKVFAKRFEKEIWPLVTRNGKDGCLGCHAGGKIVSALRLSGEVNKDFPMLLKEGFFLPEDDGSLLGRLSDKDKLSRMPRGKDPWADKELQILRTFVVDLHKKQKK